MFKTTVKAPELVTQYTREFLEKYDKKEFNYFTVDGMIEEADQFKLSCLFMTACASIGELILKREYSGVDERNKYVASVGMSMMHYYESFMGDTAGMEAIKKQFESAVAKQCQSH